MIINLVIYFGLCLEQMYKNSHWGNDKGELFPISGGLQDHQIKMNIIKVSAEDILCIANADPAC